MIDRRGPDRRAAERRTLDRRALERRTGERYAFRATIEAEEPGTGVRIVARGGDLCMGGCYVETISPFAVDTTVMLHVVKERTSFNVLSKVVHSKIGMGMGLFFDHAEADQLGVLEKWLGELEIIGSSPAIQQVLSRLAKVAPTETTVLILGETGTGKELIARAIHRRSQRSGHPFVHVNCAAIPQSLIASELFGHEKGAFTGALQRHLGRFELAQGGTFFLDEVGELPLETQIALLRVLQDREFERVGGAEVLLADVRVLAATNRDLEAAVARDTFRMDLFYRLNVFPIDVPPLRERTEDIPALVEYFVQQYASRLGKEITTVSKQTLKLFQAYHWPGNIRELQNVIERSVILCEGKVFRVDESWMFGKSRERRVPAKTLSKRLRSQEREIIEEALAKSKGRIAGAPGAAAKLGIPPSTLDHRIKKLKINKHHFRAEQ
jgi:transcriptional regulator with GAF, ATPase, and Fis domain